MRVILTVVYFLATVLSLTIAFSPIGWSWWKASQRSEVTERPLQLCAVVKAPLVKGLKVTDANLEWAIRRVRASDNSLPDPKDAVGKYALTDMAKGELVRTEHLWEFAPSAASEAGVTLPVEVKTEHAGALRPGLRLAFVQEREKARVMIPEAGKLTGEKPGLVLLSVTLAQKDSSITTLIIEVTKDDLGYVPDLASGQWRPVILSASQWTPSATLPMRSARVRNPRRRKKARTNRAVSVDSIRDRPDNNCGGRDSDHRSLDHV